MFLKNLTIYNDRTLIRDILFRKGINLIVDETESSKKTDSGNSVGKISVIRLIDFCLDGEGKNIYVDPEFKTENLKVEKFLKGNNIVITLTLTDDINDENSQNVVIKRNFLSYRKKIQMINDELYDNEKFSRKLKELIFNSDRKDPTFRQLISKNIRDEKNKLIHTLKVLHSCTMSVTYEQLFLFWLGIDTNSSKDKLVRDKNLEKKLQGRLRKESNLSQITQSLIIINKEIDGLTKKKELFNLNEKYEEDLENLNKVKFGINEISTNISRFELRKELIIESQLDLEKGIANIDTTQIKKLYEKAKSLIPNIQKTFEDTLAFHNETIQQKSQFITEELPQLEKIIIEEKRKLNSLLLQEEKLSKSLNKSGAVEDLQTIINELNAFHEQKGKFEEQKRLWEKTINNLKIINNNLEKINNEIFSKDELIHKRIEEFNAYFSDISSRLDGVHSTLSAENLKGVYKFIISNIEGNPGTGGKKSQMASFDLAYIKFADALDISCLHFVLQDQIENVHSNQITNLLTEIVDEINCQYVLPVLRDKLPTDIDVSQFEILSLSQKDKLFKL